MGKAWHPTLYSVLSLRLPAKKIRRKTIIHIPCTFDTPDHAVDVPSRIVDAPGCKMARGSNGFSTAE